MTRLMKMSEKAGLMVLMALLTSSTTGGCGEDPYLWSGGDGDLDGDTDVDVAPGCATDDKSDGQEAIFVLDSLAVGDANVGIDLDGVTTPSACNDDLCATGPDDGPGGVDNRLGPLLSELGGMVGDSLDANASLAQAVSTGQLILLLKMLDVDDWSNDGCVDLFFYTGIDPSSSPTVEQGRSYQVDRNSLAGAGTDIDNPMIAFEENGAISGGTFRGGPSVFNVSVPLDETGDVMLDITFSGAIARWEASASGARSGVLGGYISVHDLLGGLTVIPEAEDYIAILPAVLRNQADLDVIPAGTEIPGTSCTQDSVGSYSDGEGCGSPAYTCSASGRCVEPADNFDSLSIGISFTAVPANIDGIYSGG